MIVGWLASCALALGLYEFGCRSLARSGRTWPQIRRLGAWGAVALAVAAVLVTDEVRPNGALWVESVQFALLAFGVPPLCVFAAPLGLVRAVAGGGGSARASEGADASHARPVSKGEGIVALACFLVVTISWRLPVLVDALAQDRDLLLVEAVTLLGGGAWLWVALIGSPPHPAVDARPWRIGLGAMAMWATWIFAYAVGFSGHPFYPAYSGRGTVNEQEFTVGLLWASSALALASTIFRNLVAWLAAEQVVAEAEATLFRVQHAPARGRQGLPPSDAGAGGDGDGR